MAKGKHILAGLLILATFSGCVSYPISKDLQKQARSMTLVQVTAAPVAAQGAIVIWGGRIINTVNDTNGGSIYIMDLPLDSDGRPIPYSLTDGRFIAASPGFLDPEAYPNGALITVAGQVQGVHAEPLQKIQYTYPVLAIKQIHVWLGQPENQYYYYPGWYGNWYPWSPWWWYGGVGFYYLPGGHGAFHRSGSAFHDEESHGQEFQGGAFRGGGGGHGGGPGR